ncbi:MAG: AsnC family transcriptional regulator [Erysipelotrichia bacterium]|nr:AsnC family transcriptional regulator [Erysipelotrichia bacterium]
MSSNKKNYLLGTDERQEWMKKYFFAPHGLGMLEPGIVGNDSAKFAGFNVAKSFYQTHPEVFNLKKVEEKTGIKQKEIAERIKRMYDKRILMLVKNSAVSVYGFGLYYWVVKLKKDITPEQREEVTHWIQYKDEICTGYACNGDFDYYCGNHMRVLDNLLVSIIDPLKSNPNIEYVHLCPIRRDLRESSVNMFDSDPSVFRHYAWSKDAQEKLLAMTKEVDARDMAIIEALNNTESGADLFDYDVLQRLSGLDGKTMHDDLAHIVDDGRFVIPMIYLNYMKLGLTNHSFLVRLFQNVPAWRKAEIADELCAHEEFNNFFEFTDSYHDMIMMAYEEVCDIDALRKLIESYPEVEEVKEAQTPRQFRRWTARLDDQDDYWEECIFTDDFLQNRQQSEGVICPFCTDRKEDR